MLNGNKSFWLRCISLAYSFFWKIIFCAMYHSKLVVTRTSEWVCPIHNDVSRRLCYQKIGIWFNIVIITDIYITSATSVTLSFWFILVRVWHPEPRKCIHKRDFYWFLYRTQQWTRHIWFLLIIFGYTTARTPYMRSERVLESIAGLNWVFMPWSSVLTVSASTNLNIKQNNHINKNNTSY